MDKIKALNTKVMAKDFGRVGLGTPVSYTHLTLPTNSLV